MALVTKCWVERDTDLDGCFPNPGVDLTCVDMDYARTLLSKVTVRWTHLRQHADKLHCSPKEGWQDPVKMEKGASTFAKRNLDPLWNEDGGLEPGFSEGSTETGPFMPTTITSRNPSCSKSRMGSSDKS